MRREADVLHTWTGDDRVHCALWEGWGWLHAGSNTVTVFASGPDAGRLGDLHTIGQPGFGGGVSRQCPQWWWPPDRSWFVATEIDDPCTYLAGPAALIERVERLGFETVRVRDTDPW